MTSWQKGEEASLQRAIKRGDSRPKNSLDTAARKQRGKKASEKRPTAWRDKLRIELQRLVGLFFLFVSLPPRFLSRQCVM